MGDGRSTNRELTAAIPPEGDPEFTFEDDHEHGWYLIQPGDHLTIKFRVTPDLDDEVIVRPDGQIALQMIGDVVAAQRTPEELRNILTEAYAAELRDPQLTVIVRGFAGNQVFVGGEVQKSGSVALAGRMTVLQAIIQSGGFRDTADRHHVVVRRCGGEVQELDLHGELHGTACGRDIALQPSDVVYVPKSRIAKVNQFVDQYVKRILPFDLSFGAFLSYSGFSPVQTIP